MHVFKIEDFQHILWQQIIVGSGGPILKTSKEFLNIFLNLA